VCSMSDLSTFAGQAEHYAAVRARLNNAPPPKPNAPMPPRRMYLLPKVRVKPEVKYGAPINLISYPGARFLIKLVSLRTGISTDDIVGPRREAVVVAARKDAIQLVYNHCPHLSLPMIGSIFNRDHTSILYLTGRLKKTFKRYPRKSRQSPGFTPVENGLADDFSGAKAENASSGSERFVLANTLATTTEARDALAGAPANVNTSVRGAA
jgi:hypothetical protein